MIILIIGPAKCGKTMLATRISQTMPANTRFADDSVHHNDPEAFKRMVAVDSPYENWVICAQNLSVIPATVQDYAHFVYTHSGVDHDKIPIWSMQLFLR